jgi:hypothetical protein
VVAVVLAYSGVAWPKGCTNKKQRADWIGKVNVGINPLMPNGTYGKSIDVPWTEGVDAVYIFEGEEELSKLYDEEHLHFLSQLKGAADVSP